MTAVRGITGLTIGALAATVAAYLLASAAGTDGPWLLIVPVGAVVGLWSGFRWGTVRRCPACDSEVSAAASVCRFCRGPLG